MMGIVGAVLITRWSYGLIRESAKVLLDRQANSKLVANLRDLIEKDGSDCVTDLHCWSIGPGIYAAEFAVVSHSPETPEYYKSLIPSNLGVVHANIEIHHCPDQ